jgi:cellulose synthase/poly-beta-1,6-N-acetylglucosamine synthase-like glycosyltransferase
VTSRGLLGAALLLSAAFTLIAFCVRPLRQARADDLGDGWSVVALPRARSVSLARVGTFYLCSGTFTLGLVAVHPGPVQFYQALIGRLGLLVYYSPQVAAYAAHVSTALRLVVVANLAAFATVIRAPLARRVAVLANGVVFLAFASVLDSLGCVAAALVRLPTETASLLGSFFVFMVAIVTMLRLIATTFKVPRPTAVPDLRQGHRAESLLLLVGTLLAAVIVIGAVDLADTLVGQYHPTAFLVVFIGFPLVFDVLLLFLLVATRRARPPHDPTNKPPITTITPAFNEAMTIARTLESIDRAAGRYGGEVTVVLIDDGSQDTTVAVASAVMAKFRHARGRLIAADHGGKAKALNKGLEVATSDIVVRIDADVVIGENAFLYLPDWFANPAIGVVGALDLPDPRGTSFYSRGRLFECLVGFAFARVALQRVDAINCIPGTFTAFRRAPARFVGGFVSGMNGEDSDLTMMFGRLGYQVAVDTRVRIHEDVPATLRDFREQRVRWNRAGIHVLSRHSPTLAGSRSPRTWYFYIRAATVRITAVLRPIVFVTGLELSLANPATRAVAPRVLVFYLVATVPTLMAIVVLALRFGFSRQLLWLPLWLPFTLVRRVVALEALLTLPVRPVGKSLEALLPPAVAPQANMATRLAATAQGRSSPSAAGMSQHRRASPSPI